MRFLYNSICDDENKGVINNFTILNGTDYMKTFKATLLEETLSIDEKTLQNYSKALLSFWDKIPERNYSDKL